MREAVGTWTTSGLAVTAVLPATLALTSTFEYRRRDHRPDEQGIETPCMTSSLDFPVPSVAITAPMNRGLKPAVVTLFPRSCWFVAITAPMNRGLKHVP